MQYSDIPSLSRWKSDSSVFLATRSKDVVLDRIDRLIEERGRASDEARKFIFLCDIFFTADYWLKLVKLKQPTPRINPHLENGREAAMWALYRCAAGLLCKAFGCTINSLPRELELMWGRELTSDGVWVDITNNCAEYLTRSDAAKYRLWFKNGRAYQLPWWNPSAPQKPQPAESVNAYDAEAMAGRNNSLPAPNYGFFVLTMSRDLYMAKHRPTQGQGAPGFYHSSYVAGDPVQCSGTMLIENGLIKRIRVNSGHYRPHQNNVRALIMALRMWAVPCERIVFEDWSGQLMGGTGKVQDVVKNTNDMQVLDQGRADTIASNKNGFAGKPGVDRSLAPNPREWWGNRPGQKEVFPPAVPGL